MQKKNLSEIKSKISWYTFGFYGQKRKKIKNLKQNFKKN